jgi:hypothetical protein
MSARWLTGEFSRAPWLAGAAVAVVLAAAHLDLGATDSFRTTWEAVASGAERIPASGQVAIWEVPRDVVVTEPATVLHLAERVGLASSASFRLLVAVLGVVGAAGAFAIGLDLKLAPPMAGLAAAAAGSLFFAAGQSLWGTLAAAPLIWVVRGAVVGGGPALPIAVVALGVLSRPGTLLAVPVLAAGILAGGATPTAVLSLALTLGFAIPPHEVDWMRFLRHHVGHYFAYGAPYGLAQRDYQATLATSMGAGPGDGIALAAGLACWGAAAIGAVRAGRRGWAFFVAAAGFAALVTRPPGRLHEWVSSPAAFLATIAPSLQVYDLARIGGSIAALLLPPLAARGTRGTLGGALAMLALLALGWRGASVPGSGAEPIDPALTEMIEASPSRVLVLPLGVASDGAWRRAVAPRSGLVNGSQELLARNAPILAREFARADAASLKDLVGRLRVDRVLLPRGWTWEAEQVVDTARGRLLVELPRGQPAKAAKPPECLPSSGWKVTSSVGNPSVSIPQRAIDGDVDTRWGSGAPQEPGFFYEIDLGGEYRLDRLRIDFAGWPHDFPRGFCVLVGHADSSVAVVAERDPYLGKLAWGLDGSFPYDDGGASGRIEVGLGRARGHRLRIELKRGARVYDWSIGELCLVGERIDS